MAEASNSVHLTNLRARLHIATITLALQAAMKITKHQLRAQGLKPMYMPHRELRIRAEVLPHRTSRRANRRSQGGCRTLALRRLLWKACKTFKSCTARGALICKGFRCAKLMNEMEDP
jgi:hypothetical protein